MFAGQVELFPGEPTKILEKNFLRFFDNRHIGKKFGWVEPFTKGSTKRCQQSFKLKNFLRLYLEHFF